MNTAHIKIIVFALNFGEGWAKDGKIPSEIKRGDRVLEDMTARL